MERAPIEAALADAGLTLDDRQWSSMEKLQHWLATEAVEAGGVGPSEVDLLEERHLADSVLFARPWRGTAPATVLDIGSGVGLPGLVLGIVWPEAQVVLLDRSGRRYDLARRAIRILGLANVSALQADVHSHRDQYEAVVMRAVLPPVEAPSVVAPLLHPGGRSVVGLSRTQAPTNAAELLLATQAAGLTGTVEEVKVLDLRAWLLIMARS